MGQATLTDNAKRIGQNTMFGEQITASRRPDISLQFQYNIVPDQLELGNENGGGVTQENDMIKVFTGTDPNGVGSAKSIRAVRYRPGFEAYVIFTGMFETGGVADSIQHMGGFAGDLDGYYLGFTNTDFIIGRKKDGTRFETTQQNFNRFKLDGTDNGPNVDFTKLNIFKISWGWLGTGPVNYEIMDKDGSWRLFHQSEFPGTLTAPHVTNPVLPLAMMAEKTAGSTDIIMRSGSWNGGMIGDDFSVGEKRFSDDKTNSVTTEEVVATYRVKETFQSKENRTPIQVDYLTVITDGNKPVVIRIYQNGIITNPVYSDFDSTISIVEIDTVGTITGGDLKFGFGVEPAGGGFFDLLSRDLELVPGDTLTITAESSTSNDTEIIFGWRELF